MSNGSEPAFPTKNETTKLGDAYVTLLGASGLSKRELIAAMCLQGLLSTLTIERDAHSKFLAETAVMHADALLAELSSNKESGE